MSFRIKCTCGKQFGVKDQYAGKKGKCPHCGAALVLQPPEGYAPKPETPKREGKADKPAAAPASARRSPEADKPTPTPSPKIRRPAPGEKVKVRLSDEEVEIRSAAAPRVEVSAGKPGDPPPMAEYRHVIQRFCPTCGTRYNENQARCSNCHAPLSEEEIKAAEAAKKPPLFPWLPRFHLSTKAMLLTTGLAALLVAGLVYAFCLHTPLRQKARLQAELTLIETALTAPEDQQVFVETGSPDLLVRLTLEMPGFPWDRPATVPALGKWERRTGGGVFPTNGTGTYDLEKRELTLSFEDGPKTYTYHVVLRPMLHVAALAGNIDCLRMLLKQPGCKVDVTDSQGNTPLHAAAGIKGDQVEPAKVLLEYNADHRAMNTAGMTPLAIALGARNEKITDLLKKHGAIGPAGVIKEWH